MRGALKSGFGCVLATALIAPVEGFFIPGWSVKTYNDAESIPLLVNKIWSDNSQLQYAYYDLPFVCPPTGARKPASGLPSGHNIPLNLGEVLRGDRIAVSDLELAMATDMNCTMLCERRVTRRDLTKARELIGDGYVAEWIVDDLPSATRYISVDKKRKYYTAGFRLGRVEKTARALGGTLRYLLYNHYDIVVRYRRAPGAAKERQEMVIVGFEVFPKSIAANADRDETGCLADASRPAKPFELELPWRRTSQLADDSEAGNTADEVVAIPYTYAVKFIEDETIEYAKRWDRYYASEEEGACIHWIGIVNSLIVCGLLTAVVSTLLSKSIRAEMQSRKEEFLESGLKQAKAVEKTQVVIQETEVEADMSCSASCSGSSSDEDPFLDGLEDLSVMDWKFLRADVFRPPRNAHLLAPLVGSGTQLLFTVVGLVLLSSLGIFGPSFRGGVVSVGVGLFVFAGLLSGYVSARVYRTLDVGADLRRNALVTATLVPGLMFISVFVLNLFVWAQASTTAMPFGTVIALAALWLGVQVPLVYAGSWYGVKHAAAWDKPSKKHRVSSSQHSIPLEEIRGPLGPSRKPSQPWYFAPMRVLLLSGFVPFSVIILELLSIFRSLYHGPASGPFHTHRQHLFSMTSSSSLSSALLPPVTLLLMLVTVAQTAIVSVHLHLCGPSTAPSSGWWWRAFVTGASPAAWVFGYASWYYRVRLPALGLMSAILYFGNAFIAACVLGLLTGTMGLLSAYAFVRRVYGTIKTD